MENARKINEILDSIYNMTSKLEEQSLKALADFRLSPAEIRTLEAIGIRQARTMSQVAWALNIKVSTLTSAVNKLVKKEYVERYRPPQDRRMVKIRLTESGVKAVQLHRRERDRIISQVISEMNEEELAGFVPAMEDLRRFFSMQQYEPVRDQADYALKPIQLGSYNLSIPIFQGGMGIGVSMSKLAGAVAAAGGLGLVSAAEPGFHEADYARDPVSANIRALKKHVEKAVKTCKEAGAGGLVGVNVLTSEPEYKRLVEAAIEAGAQVIVSGGGLPMNLPAVAAGWDVALVPIVSSARAARLIKANWAKKHGRKPDAFVFESPFAGGHLGYRESQVDTGKDQVYRNLLEIREEAGSIPLIAGGGIINRKDAVRAFSYGADGLQLGSLFIPTEECDAAPAFKKMYEQVKTGEITIIDSPRGMPCQVIRNEFVKNLKGTLTLEEENAALIRAVNGDTQNGLFLCGGKVPDMTIHRTVADVFAEFV